MEIMFVCTGNICRSPMAEALFRSELEQRGIQGVSVVSSGTWGQDGSGPTVSAAQALRTMGIDLGSHRARTVSEPALAKADLIVVMTQHQGQDHRLERHAHKIRYLRELSELTPAPLEDGATPAQRMEALLAAPRPPYRRALELDDPYGLPAGVYERTASEIRRHVADLARLLFGPIG